MIRSCRPAAARFAQIGMLPSNVGQFNPRPISPFVPTFVETRKVLAISEKPLGGIDRRQKRRGLGRRRQRARFLELGAGRAGSLPGLDEQAEFVEAARDERRGLQGAAAIERARETAARLGRAAL